MNRGRRALRSTVLAALCACFASGCDVFEESLYQQRGGLPVLAIADRCQGTPPIVQPGDVSYEIDTASLGNHLSELGCLDADTPGSDGFFAVEMEERSRWHFHLKTTSPEADPALYVLPSCDERACPPRAGLDECGVGRDEHLTFFAPRAGRFLVGIDSRVTGGARYELLVLNPECGDGDPVHSEPCDDGNDEPGDGCDAQCRAELSSDTRAEVEPNDEAANANVVATAAGMPLTVSGRLGGRCDFDMYALNVPEGGSVNATMLGSGGQPCDEAAPPFLMRFIRPDGGTLLGSGTVAAGNACPVLDGAAFATGLDAGIYYVRVTTENDEIDPFDYQLQLEVLAP